MEGRLVLHQVDVFTQVPYTGNPAGVVLDADGLSAAAMQAVARELHVSETAFVFREKDEGVVPVRFFTPTREVPVCGHASLAAHFVRARSRGELSGSVTQRSPGATWRVSWRTGPEGTMVTMRQGPVEWGPQWEGQRRVELLAALGIGSDALTPEAPVRVLSTGHAKVVVPVNSAADLMRVEPDMGALAALSRRTGVGGYFLFAPNADGGEALTVCRMFGPAIGVHEDPVNGSGHGPLGAYLASRGGPAAEAARGGFWSGMGDHLARPGRVRVQVVEEEGVVNVGGFVTPLFSTEVPAPDRGEFS